MIRSGRNTRNRILKPEQNRGSALVLFAIVLLVIFGVSALVIDMGLVRMSRIQMSNAADAGAIQGLRHRDSGLVDDRLIASQQVTAWFDDDFNPATDALSLGAGPVVTVLAPTDANTNVPRIIGGSPYDPELRENPTNFAHGDMMTGNYLPGERHDEGYSMGNFYERDDFPSAFDELTPHNSFLVRIRRTRDANGLDNIAGVSSSGPGIPFIFGQGAALDGDMGSFNPRTDGLSLGVTSISDAQPTLSAGPQHTPALSGSGLPGLAWISLDQDYFNLLPVGVFSVASIDATGLITGIGVTTGGIDGSLTRRTSLAGGITPVDTSFTASNSGGFPPVPFTIRLADELMEVTAIDFGTDVWTVDRGVQGSVASAHLLDSPVHLFEVAVIGDPLRPTLPVNLLVPTSAEPEFVAIYQGIGGAGERTTGFGGILIRPLVPVSNPPVFPVAIEILKAPEFIPVDNASAKLARGVDPSLTASQVNDIFANRRLITEPLRSPALVLTY